MTTIQMKKVNTVGLRVVQFAAVVMLGLLVLSLLWV